MLLTLTVTADRPVFTDRRGRPELLKLPGRVRDELGLHGINLSTDLLVGADRGVLDGLRDAADKARCSCLLLIERNPLLFAIDDDAQGMQAQQRAIKVLEAASLLGCNAASISISGQAGNEEAIELAVERLKPVVERAERLEVNLLLSPSKGMTQEPDDLTELIKRVGGFRIGTFPDFRVAQASGDPEKYLRRLTPYAAVVQATTIEFGEPPELPEPPAAPKKAGASAAEALLAAIEALDDEEVPVAPHTAYDLEPLVRSVVSVGYDGTLALSYEGKGDCTLGVERSRDALEDVIVRLSESE